MTNKQQSNADYSFFNFKQNKRKLPPEKKSKMKAFLFFFYKKIKKHDFLADDTEKIDENKRN